MEMERKKWNIEAVKQQNTNSTGSSNVLNKLLEYQTELQDRTQGIIQAKTKAVEDLKWVKENVEKMEETLSSFQNAQLQVTTDKRNLASELANVEKRMAERTVEVEARLKDAAATVVGLRDKIVSLEKDIKVAKSEEVTGFRSDQPSPSSDNGKSTEILKERLVAAEAQLKSDSDLISKLYERVCILNNNLVDAKNKGLKSGSNPGGAAKNSATVDKNQAKPMTPNDPRRFNRDAGASPSSDVTDPDAEIIFHTAGKKMEAAGIKLHDASEKVEAAEVQLQDATKTIAQLREKVRVLTDEVKRARSASPDYGKHTSPDYGKYSEGVGSPFKPSLNLTRLEEPASVRAHKMEDALTQAQEKIRLLSLEIGYMEKKKAAALDAIKTLDAAIADKRSALKSAGQDAKKMKRSMKRNSSLESSTGNKGGLGNLFKMFQKPENNAEKYMIKQQIRRL